MTEPVETAGAVVSLEAGIVHIRSKGVPSSVESVTETLEVVEKLVEGTPRPVLWDVREWPGGEPAAWFTVISAMSTVFSRVAMLIDPDQAPEVGGYPETIDRLLMPFRAFAAEEEALEFLHEGPE